MVCLLVIPYLCGRNEAKICEQFRANKVKITEREVQTVYAYDE